MSKLPVVSGLECIKAVKIRRYKAMINIKFDEKWLREAVAFKQNSFNYAE